MPFVSRLHHQIDCIAVFNVVLLEKLSIGQSFALEKQSLAVGRGRPRLRRELRLDVGNGVCQHDREVESLCLFQRLYGDVNR